MDDRTVQPTMSGPENLLGRTLRDAVKEAQRIALESPPTKRTFALFSGGSDSTVLLDVCQVFIDAVLFIDTTCGIRQTQEFVEEECKRRGLTLHVQRPPASYEEIVRERGFFGPKDHPYAYRLLKKAAVREFKKKHLEWRGKDKLTFLTGMRAGESKRRMGHGALDRLEERIWWVNPLRSWSNEVKWAYIKEQGLRINPVSEVMGKSGECNCGCFAHPADKEIIRDLDPDLAARIDRLEAELEAKGSPFCKWAPGGRSSAVSCACFGQEAWAV